MRARVHPARLRGDRMERADGLRAVGKHGSEPSFTHKGRAAGYSWWGVSQMGIVPEGTSKGATTDQCRAFAFRFPRLAENLYRIQRG